MKSHPKKRSRSAETARGAKPRPPDVADDKSAPSPPVAYPPKRNVAMLSVSIIVFVIWISFLVYVALFG
ncbi:MAG: hypothetical protein ABI614_12330 [Planctomycetota bacterium]